MTEEQKKEMFELKVRLYQLYFFLNPDEASENDSRIMYHLAKDPEIQQLLKILEK
jgi:hypothetical protein